MGEEGIVEKEGTAWDIICTAAVFSRLVMLYVSQTCEMNSERAQITQFSLWV